jgi:hypothetical protein
MLHLLPSVVGRTLMTEPEDGLDHHGIEALTLAVNAGFTSEPSGLRLQLVSYL